MRLNLTAFVCSYHLISFWYFLRQPKNMAIEAGADIFFFGIPSRLRTVGDHQIICGFCGFRAQKVSFSCFVISSTLTITIGTRSYKMVWKKRLWIKILMLSSARLMTCVSSSRFFLGIGFCWIASRRMQISRLELLCSDCNGALEKNNQVNLNIWKRTNLRGLRRISPWKILWKMWSLLEIMKKFVETLRFFWRKEEVSLKIWLKDLPSFRISPLELSKLFSFVRVFLLYQYLRFQFLKLENQFNKIYWYFRFFAEKLVEIIFIL